MSDDVNSQETVPPETAAPSQEALSNKELNFRRLEAAREAEREARIKAEMQAEAMRRELADIKEMLKPKETDPLDDVEDYVDPARLRAKLEKERARSNKEARAIAEQIYEEHKQKDEKENFLPRLKMQYPDYDQVMNETNLAALEQADPVFIKAILANKDEKERRMLAYEKIKSMQVQQKPKTEPSIKERVEENSKNPYYIQPTVGTSASAIDFDISSKSAREAAYAKLKAAQKLPIGGGGPAAAYR